MSEILITETFYCSKCAFTKSYIKFKSGQTQKITQVGSDCRHKWVREELKSRLGLE